MNEHGIHVRPGQVWADNDPRVVGRTLRVERIAGRHVICTVLTNSHEAQASINSGRNAPGSRSTFIDRRGATTQISINRFKPTSTGYRLLLDASPENSGG